MMSDFEKWNNMQIDTIYDHICVCIHIYIYIICKYISSVNIWYPRHDPAFAIFMMYVITYSHLCAADNYEALAQSNVVLDLLLQGTEALHKIHKALYNILDPFISRSIKSHC